MFGQLENCEKRYQELEHLLAMPEALANKEEYHKLAKELADLREPVQLLREYRKINKEIADLEKVLKEKHEPQFWDLAQTELADLQNQSRKTQQKIEQWLKGEDKEENKNIIIEIRQGTGGGEAALFAADLYRMYTKYAARKNWTVEPMSAHPTELGGFKEIVFSVQGKGAYQYLKFESGVHRVQRVPETEAQGRIHTSTATVAVLVEPEEVELVIAPKDLKIETYRSSGPGGQHMQKTDSAVRITHLPTQTVVTCQDERSQIKNKTKAMRILAAKLLDSQRQEEAKKISQERKSQIGSGERSEKIRTYNFPDRRVTDHRINYTSHQLEAVLDGELDEFLTALIRTSEEKKND